MSNPGLMGCPSLIGRPRSSAATVPASVRTCVKHRYAEMDRPWTGRSGERWLLARIAPWKRSARAGPRITNHLCEWILDLFLVLDESAESDVEPFARCPRMRWASLDRADPAPYVCLSYVHSGLRSMECRASSDGVATISPGEWRCKASHIARAVGDHAPGMILCRWAALNPRISCFIIDSFIDA